MMSTGLARTAISALREWRQPRLPAYLVGWRDLRSRCDLGGGCARAQARGAADGCCSTNAEGDRQARKLIGIETALMRVHFLTKLWQDWIEFFLLERLGSIFREVRCESRNTGLRWTSSGC